MLLPYTQSGHDGVWAEADNGADGGRLAWAVLLLLLLAATGSNAWPLGGCQGAELKEEGEQESCFERPKTDLKLTRHGGWRQVQCGILKERPSLKTQQDMAKAASQQASQSKTAWTLSYKASC